MNEIMLYAGAAVVIIWGIAHIVIPTRSIVDGFGPISADNRRTLLMEWLMEGVLLIFIGTLVILMTTLTHPEGQAAVIVYRACSAVLVVMAGISLFTGARTTILPMRLCPLIFLAAAALFLLATVI
ncbi:MAG: hypothetical protein OEW64_10895 [Gammaproteobacteria bacterium]|nr:hypothetical protein [Gammaproteobacteria bacterium]MDH5304586.1 hypothetical protein [Gammaproteobacteria bacterium]